MRMDGEKTKRIPLTLLIVVILILPHINIAGAQEVSLETDASSYSPGDLVTVRGTGAPNSLLALQVTDARGTSILITSVQTSGDGKFTRAFRLPTQPVEGQYTVTASHDGIVRTATFTLVIGAVKLILLVTPEKGVYRDEIVTVHVVTDKPLKSDPTITVTQTGARPFKVDVRRSATNEWVGSYTLQKGFDGTATIDAVGEDALGNKGTASKIIVVDTLAPNVSITAPREVYEPTIAVSGAVDDPSISSIELMIDDQPVRKVAVIQKVWNTEVTFAVPGTHKLSALAKDAAGNTATAITTVTVTRALGALTIMLDVQGVLQVGSNAVVWVHTSVEGKPVVPSNLSASIIQPDGTEKPLSFSPIRSGLARGTFPLPLEGNYLVVVDASWKGTEGSAVKGLQTTRPPELIAPIIQPLIQPLIKDVDALRKDLASLLNLVIIAIALSVAAAASAIAAVLQITRKLVLK